MEGLPLSLDALVFYMCHSLGAVHDVRGRLPRGVPLNVLDEGLLLCPEGAATYAAYQKARADGRIKADETCVLYNCATGLKYPLPPMDQALDRHQPIDYAALAKA